MALYVQVRIVGGPYDGQYDQVQVTETKQADSVNGTIGNPAAVPIYRDDKGYYIQWEDLE